ncbi:MAG: peptidylprolyl isomerase [Candidatus Gastranaerophilales bacterium]|nr:peptidylprolyl isomerase [Candidatus Gastranaerophilales bacterium]
MKKFILGLLTVSLMFTVGCWKKEEKAADTGEVIITVNDSKITKKEYDQLYKEQADMSFLTQQNIDLESPQNKLFALIIKNSVINELIMRELINQELAKRNIEITKKDVDNKINEIIKKVGGKSKLEATLTLNNISKKQFHQNIEKDLKIQKLLENSLIDTKVSENEIKEFYEKNKKEKFEYPNMVRAKHILVSVSDADVKEVLKAQNPEITDAELVKEVQKEFDKAKEKAEKILKQVKNNPEKFEDIAKSSSDDYTSAQNGGDLGFFTEEEMVPEFSKVAFSQKPGTVSDLVKSDYGYHIIMVVDRKEAGTTPLSEVHDDIQKYLANQKKMEATYKLLDGLKNSAKITYVNDEYNTDKIEKEVKELAEKQMPKEMMKK